MTLLRVDDLVLHYETSRGPVRAVDGVSFSIDGPGEVLALIGESGSGKTSLARGLMRLLPTNVGRYEGRVLLDGNDVMMMPDDHLRRQILWREISMVFQGAMSSLNPVLRVGRQVAEPLIKGGVSDRSALAEADRLLELVGLPGGTSRRFPHELSGGMKQRVVVAMALIYQPKLVLLDEPTSALDVSVQAQLMNLFKELKRDLQVSMLFITHDIALASDLSDQIAVIHAGEIREHGTAEQVFTDPLDPYTRALLGSVPRLHSRTRPGYLSGATPDLVDPPPGCRFHPRCVYVFEPCPTYPPPLLEPHPGRTVRCWLFSPGEFAGAEPSSRTGPVAEGRQEDLEGSVDTFTPVSAEPLVEIEDLRVHFHSRRRLFRTDTIQAVNGVTLTINKGEILALVGESGSGKTTLGRSTLGLVAPTEGTVRFADTDLTTLRTAEAKAFRRRAQAVFQDPFASISPFMSVFEVVEEPLLVHGLGDRDEREQRVLAALTQVRFDPASTIAAAYPHNLSGGQRQRVGIARALVLDPEYVVADEPVSMIDASSRAEILDLLSELRAKRGITFLYITHDIATARHFSDRIAVMYAGRLVEVGDSDEVVDHPRHPYTKALLVAVPEPDPGNRLRLREAVPGEAPDPTAIPAGCPFHPRCPEAIAGTCETVVPTLVEMSSGNWVACHLYPPETSSSDDSDGSSSRPSTSDHR